MRLWFNAANAVLVTSDYEGFGMVCVEALACEVPVLSTPVGIAPFILDGLDGALCAPFDLDAWSAAARPLLDSPDPRVDGAGRAAALSAGGWRNARSRPIATYSPSRNRLEPR